MSEKHEPAGADVYQAIPGLTEDIASGRVEDSSSFSQKSWTMCNFFVKMKKSTMLPQASLAAIG